MLKKLLVVAGLAALAGCGQQPYYAQQQPQVVYQQPSYGYHTRVVHVYHQPTVVYHVHTYAAPRSSYRSFSAPRSSFGRRR